MLPRKRSGSAKRPHTKSSPVSSQLQKIELAYTLFDDAEQTQRLLTLDDICAATGYSLRTARGYISKKWWWFLYEQGSSHYCVKGLHHHPKSYFVDLHRQKVRPEPGLGVKIVKEIVKAPVDHPARVSSDDIVLLLSVLCIIALGWRLSRRGWWTRGRSWLYPLW